LPESTLLDVANLLSIGSHESSVLRKQIKGAVVGDDARRFWKYDFDKYKKDDLGPPKNKLSKLLIGGTVGLMLSQPDSVINLRRVMDEQGIFLADLSALGSEVREVLGRFLLALLYQTALSRSDTPMDAHSPCHLHVDEAHRFTTNALEDILAETRKYKVSLTLAHHYLSQFGKRRADALATAASTIMFNVSTRDAKSLAGDLRKLVAVDDLITLGVGEAVVRCGSELARIRTLAPALQGDPEVRNRIIQRSRERYCRPIADVRRDVRRRGRHWNEPVYQDRSHESEHDYAYDEL
jgi:hypothetical protein